MTLSFVPKLVVVIFTFGLLSTFMLTQLSDFFMFTFDQIPGRLDERCWDWRHRR